MEISRKTTRTGAHLALLIDLVVAPPRKAVKGRHTRYRPNHVYEPRDSSQDPNERHGLVDAFDGGMIVRRLEHAEVFRKPCELLLSLRTRDFVQFLLYLPTSAMASKLKYIKYFVTSIGSLFAAAILDIKRSTLACTRGSYISSAYRQRPVSITMTVLGCKTYVRGRWGRNSIYLEIPEPVPRPSSSAYASPHLWCSLAKTLRRASTFANTKAVSSFAHGLRIVLELQRHG